MMRVLVFAFALMLCPVANGAPEARMAASRPFDDAASESKSFLLAAAGLIGLGLLRRRK